MKREEKLIRQIGVFNDYGIMLPFKDTNLFLGAFLSIAMQLNCISFLISSLFLPLPK